MSSNNDKDFQNLVALREKSYEVIKELLEKATENAFSKLGYKRIETYQGEYGTGEKYGHGAEEGKYDIKLIGKTKSFIEKLITLGAKRTNSFIDLDLGVTGILKVHYNTTEKSVGRYNENGPLMISATISVDANKPTEMKKDLKKFFDEIAKQEVAYITETKLNVEDKTETHIDSISENTNMLSFKKLFFGSIEETEKMMEDFINEARKAEEKADKKAKQNHPDVKAANTIDTDNGKLLFDDEAEEEEEKDEVSEITTAGTMGAPGTAGPFQYNTPFAFKKALKAKKESMKRPTVKKEMGSDGFWTKVDIEPLQKTHVMGMPGVEPNSKEELKRSMNGNKSSKMNESVKPLDLTKRKFIDDKEREELGINKRYIVTKKLTAEEESAKWAKLSGFKIYESIRDAEEVLNEEILKECGCDNVDDENNVVTRDEYEKLVNTDFQKVNDEGSEESDVPSEEGLVVVSKPDSFISYQFKEEDFLNENKYFIKDFITGNYVINPNHTSQKK